ncbi:hypothetical protein H2198_001888 [Neophaeococcomyces mojaviensis]|uniref:Uncharacterized protein n=1 Tax=Neophaeococcomyces mojaviensis TaxID=3383035 RepID=A0ACC3AFP0_9EURO|nr:hypothetical protein H2198_001888 [Knufia sp. JES_112]
MLAGLAAAAPAAPSWNSWGSNPTAPSGPSSTGISAGNLKSGNPFSFPLPNGFPTLSDAAKQEVNILAQGTEPNGGAPTLTADDLTSFQLIAFNELFEVAFFTDLLYNVTNNVQGFSFQDQAQRQKVISALVAVQAQEELHADNANAVLMANGKDPIQPCQYKFPTTNLNDAFTLAATFTDVVLGTLQDVQLHLAQNNDDGVVPIIGSVIGQEGEQNGFYRSFNGLIPSAKPFLTRASREFAFSALNQAFVVPGSCPNSHEINLPVFLPLTVVTSPVEPKDQLITYSVPVDKAAPPAGLSIVLINGQNTPIVESVQYAQVSNGIATFQANFPFSANVLDGLTIAALTSSAGPFASAEEVANKTIAGPGLIEIN